MCVRGGTIRRERLSRACIHANDDVPRAMEVDVALLGPRGFRVCDGDRELRD